MKVVISNNFKKVFIIGIIGGILYKILEYSLSLHWNNVTLSLLFWNAAFLLAITFITAFIFTKQKINIQYYILITPIYRIVASITNFLLRGYNTKIFLLEIFEAFTIAIILSMISIQIYGLINKLKKK